MGENAKIIIHESDLKYNCVSFLAWSFFSNTVCCCTVSMDCIQMLFFYTILYCLLHEYDKIQVVVSASGHESTTTRMAYLSSPMLMCYSAFSRYLIALYFPVVVYQLYVNHLSVHYNLYKLHTEVDKQMPNLRTYAQLTVKVGIDRQWFYGVFVCLHVWHALGLP